MRLPRQRVLRAARCGLAMALVLSLSAPAVLASDHLRLSARSAILMDALSGEVFYEQNPHEALAPASVTKVFTLVIVLEALRDGRIGLDDMVTASRRARSMGGTQIWLEVGEQMSVKDLLYAVAVESANDAAVALAEYVAGSEEAFAELMNQRARELGARNTHLSNATGLPPEDVGMAGRRHVTTAHDIAVVSRYAYTLPMFRELVSTYGPYQVRPGTSKIVELWSRNRLLRFYPGMDGIKTGFTQEARFCLAASALRDNLRLIAVVMGAPSSDERNDDIRRLLDWGFSRYRAVEVVKQGEPLGEVAVSKGASERVAVVAARDVFVTVPRGAQLTPAREVLLARRVDAPVAAGQRVGSLVVRLDGKELDRVDLVAAAPIPRGSFVTIVWRTVNRLMGSFLP